LRAFAILSNRRAYTLAGPQPIQISEINAWCDAMSVVHGPQREEYLNVIVMLDNEYLPALLVKG